MKSLSKTLLPIIAKLDAFEQQFKSGQIKSFQYGETRIDIIQNGLELLGDFFGFPASVRYESTGELTFNGTRGRRNDSPCKPFGEPLAQLLNTIPTRTGVIASQGHVMAQNGWTRINHFEAEKLLRYAAQKHISAERTPSSRSNDVRKCA